MAKLSKKIQHSFVLPQSAQDLRIDQALTNLLPAYSRTQIKTWIEDGSLLVDQKVTKPKAKVKGGEQIDLQAELKPTANWVAQDMPLDIVFEDDSILIINKPVGLVVHPGAGNSNHTLLNALLHYLPELNLLPRAGIIHRLDKNTSGLLMIAKTPLAYKSLTSQLKKRTISREYKALVYGTLISGGTINAAIGRHPINRKRMATIETGRTAITHYLILEKFRAHTLLNVRLETGRTHQIRVHFAFIKHPIVGDPVYGGRVKLAKNMSPELIDFIRGFKHQALHAAKLGLEHPLSKKWLEWEVPWPEDLQKLITLLKKDKGGR